MTTQMMIRIDSAVKDRFMRLVRREGKTASQAIRDVLESYVEEHDIASYVDDLWGRMGRRMKAKKVTPKKIIKAIQDVRRKIRCESRSRYECIYFFFLWMARPALLLIYGRTERLPGVYPRLYWMNTLKFCIGCTFIAVLKPGSCFDCLDASSCCLYQTHTLSGT